jgi:Spx/MgsR family transcriptional regulator
VKAKQLLGTTGATVQERQYFKQKPTLAEVKALAALLPGGVRDILSTRSRRYKELGLAAQTLTDSELIDLLVVEPGLWRRPIIVSGDKAIVGYNQQELTALLS